LINRIQALERVVASTSGQTSSEPERHQRHQNTFTPSSESGHPKSYSPPSHQHNVSFSESEFTSTQQQALHINAPRISLTPGDNDCLSDTRFDSSNTENQASPVNAMGATSYIGSRGVSPSDEFYGGSSAAHFMYQVKETITRPSLFSHRPRSPMPSGAKLSSPGSESYDLSVHGNLSLPARDLADMLLDKYWTKADSLYPFIHKPSFVTAYENLWLPLRECQRSSGGQDLGLGTPEISDSGSAVFHWP